MLGRVRRRSGRRSSCTTWSADPWEQRNLADAPGACAVQARPAPAPASGGCRRQTIPLLHGPVASPYYSAALAACGPSRWRWLPLALSSLLRVAPLSHAALALRLFSAPPRVSGSGTAAGQTPSHRAAAPASRRARVRSPARGRAPVAQPGSGACPRRSPSPSPRPSPAAVAETPSRSTTIRSRS